MRGIISLPFRFVRAGRFGLIAVGAGVTGLGLWLQINGVPPSVGPVISGLNLLLSAVVDPQNTVFGLLSKIGGVMALLGLLGMTLHDIAPATGNAAEPDDDLWPAPADAPAPVRAAHASWQDRLASKTTTQAAASVAPTRSFTAILRRLVAGLVICAFLAVLGATIYGQMNSGSGVDATQPPGRAMIAADLTQSDAIAAPIATSPANTSPASTSGALPFDISKIDPATIIPWFKDQLARAFAGDQAAMIALGSIAGAFFALMVVFKIIFALRRNMSRRASIREMGFN